MKKIDRRKSRAGRRGRTRPWHRVLIVLLWVAASLAPALGATGPRRAPDFSLRDLGGRSVGPGELRGGNVLILFGSTRCRHCTEALGILEHISETVGADLHSLFIGVGQSAEELGVSFGGERPPYSILADETGSVGSSYGIRRVPTFVFIDEKGFIQYSGRVDEELIWRLISGERLSHADGEEVEIRASERFGHAAGAEGGKAKRFIVELSADPRAKDPKTTTQLLNAMRESRRKQYAESARRIGAKMIHNYGKLSDRIVVEIDPNKADRLREFPRFRNFREDRRVRALLEDSAYQIKADYAWDSGVTGQGVKVCVVDTGIDYTHPDLLNKVVAQYNPMDDGAGAMDDNGHGTHCAGIVASEGFQYRGVSYDVSLLGAKVLDATGAGYASDVILGVNWCVERGADVISLSLGEGLFSGTCDDDEMAKAVNAAVDAGAVVVCAAGNDGDSTAMVSPACASKVIAVGAVDKNDGIASYSDGGPELDLVAPGGGDYGGKQFAEIVSTFSTEVANNPFYCLYLIGEECYDNYFVVDGTRYIRAVGTSMATPHVAGAAALLLEENPSLTPAQVKQVLEENADDLGQPGWDNVYGWGRINLEKALDNLPMEMAELSVRITEPNASDAPAVGEHFALGASVDCFGGDGCGEVKVYAQLCEGRDCNDFADMSAVTAISTLDNNPNDLGILSGYSVEADAPVVFDAQTVLDVSENAYAKSVNPGTSLIGSEIPSEYSTGDLEPDDNLGAIGEDVEKLYEFKIPAGVVTRLKVRLEHWMVIHWVEPYAGWYVYTSNANGDNLNRVGGDCIPAEGGGGEEIPPDWDCWFVTEDPEILKDLNPGGTSYIKLASHDVYSDEWGNPDWLTFNDITAIVEYEMDPNNDEVYRYYVKFDLSEIDPNDEVTAARMKINVAEAAEDAVAEVYFVDDTLLPTDSAQGLHEPADPPYSSLINPVKSFSCGSVGTKSVNVKAAVDAALGAGRDSIAFQMVERNNDQVVRMDGAGSQLAPTLTISQKVNEIPDGQGGGVPANEPNNGPRPLDYDTLVVRNVSSDGYSRLDGPELAVIGADFTSEYNTGDLEPEDGIGAMGGDAEKLYDFEIPDGVVKNLRIRMTNYLVIHWDYPPFATWQIYTSDSDGSNLHFVGECTPAEGGGGEPVPPDCWFDSNDPAVLADLRPGGTSHIKLVSYGVGENDWLTFSDLEVMVEYETDPNESHVSRYYVKFGIGELVGAAEIDSATLSLSITEPAEHGTALVNLAEPTYDPCTGAYTIYHAERPDYSSLTNPLKSLATDRVGPIQLNVKAALEDAVESASQEIAFLIAERDETDKSAAFTIDAGGGANPPRLEVYMKSGISGGVVRWNLLPTAGGEYKLRVLAENNVGITGVSDERVVNVHDPNLPVVGAVECMINSMWGECAEAGYGDHLQKIRVEADDPQGAPEVRLVLRNVPDDHNFVDTTLTYNEGYYVHETDLVISDCGQWQIRADCTDSDENTATKTINWNIPWGSLTVSVASPAGNISVAKSGSFLVETELGCLDGECPSVKAALQLNEPNELKYDDGTAQDYGDLGSTNSYLAVKFEPESYPVQLRTARFYVWDKTTYPFELHVWDDNGSFSSPGTELVAPFVVDPVAASGPNEVAWFDVDLTDHDIIIESGQFYIGWRQIEEGKLNQVGFDTTGIEYRRTWGFLPSLGWFNLDDYCQWCSLLPEFCDFCGNIMIRAVVGEPWSFEGELPRTAVASPLYTPDEHPEVCPELKAGEMYEADFTVYAVGAAGQKARLYGVARNSYSYDITSPVTVTITAPETSFDAANLDAVGRIDFGDLAVLAAQWLQSAPPLSADINLDGSVDLGDVVILANQWLSNGP